MALHPQVEFSRGSSSYQEEKETDLGNRWRPNRGGERGAPGATAATGIAHRIVSDDMAHGGLRACTSTDSHSACRPRRRQIDQVGI
ncbi:hypothetical protein PIIN_08896 [Serendipita indica DSM 11827]|uniref:Uncharacterized protein n=1 Tax=Serendipita indica (strain DSM 11827) TaxID=1109443 RepID=G4TUD3_SERID|nr:hypothetical protein PIIN_08896 [Serendipita indica DSM 11827]